MFYHNTYVFNIFPTEISKLVYTFLTHPFTEARHQLFISIKLHEKTISDDVIMILKHLKINQLSISSMDYAHMTHEERLEFDSYHSRLDQIYNQEMAYYKLLYSSNDMRILPRHCHKLSKIIKNAYSYETDTELNNNEYLYEYLYEYQYYCYANEKILGIRLNNLLMTNFIHYPHL